MSRRAAPPPSSIPAEVERWIVRSLLALLVVLCVTSLVGDAPTVDEFVYPVEGRYYIATGDFRFNPQNPPLVKLLSAIPLLLDGARLDLDPRWHRDLGGWEPWVLGTRFMLDNVAHYHRLFVEARLISVAFALALGLALYRWSSVLWGTAGGLLSLALYVLCPNILAHARLATPDFAVTLFMFLASWALWRAATRSRREDLVLLGAMIGLAFASKFSALLLFPILGAQLWLLRRHRSALGVPRRWRFGWSPWQCALVVVGVATLVLDLTYGLRGLFAPWSTIPFASSLFRGLARSMPWLRLPVPDAFLLGIDAKTADAGGAEFPGFMFGSWSRDGFRSFYVASWLTKTPVAGLVLAVLAVAWRRASDTSRQRAALLLGAAGPVAFIVLATLLFSKVNYGLRYLLPMFPFIHLACGRVATLATTPRARAAVAALVAAYAAETLAVHPHYLSFFNASVGGPADGWHAFVDSNTDWGQDLRRLREWMDQTGTRSVHLAYFGHVSPRVYGIDATPLHRGDRPSGVIAISTSLLQGLPYPNTWERPGSVVGVGAEDYAWLRTETPIGRAGMSILLFRVAPR